MVRRPSMRVGLYEPTVEAALRLLEREGVLVPQHGGFLHGASMGDCFVLRLDRKN